MPELRQNQFTKEWVIIATERARRPEELVVKRPARELPTYSEKCPFCPGNESQTPPEVFRYPMNDDDPWQVRVFPNKFAALSREAEPRRSFERSHRKIEGFGVHDVIVETPDHSLSMARLPESAIGDVLRAYKARYDQLSLDPRIAHITIFKNHGAGAGTSLEHPHSQLIGTPVISSQVRQRFQEALRHWDDYGDCMFCEMIREEMFQRTRVVAVSEHFVAMEYFASATPFSTYIYPLRHMASFGDISTGELNDLAGLMKNILAKLYVGLNDPDFNYVIRSAPAESAGVKYYHWYVSIIPRLTRVAGFELGSGMFINTVLPEAAAEFLRNVKVEEEAAVVVP